MLSPVAELRERLGEAVEALGVRGGRIRCNIVRITFSQIFLLLFFIFSSGASNAQDPTFTSVVSTNKLIANTVFEIQFELNNAKGEDFTPPDFTDFKVVGGPSMGSSTMIVNGQVSRSQSWTYSLLATREGHFTIGSANVIAGRRKLATRPIAIEVTSAGHLSQPDPNATGGESIALLADIAEGEYYPGQQIILNYKLLFRENVQSVNLISEDDYADFFIQNFNSISQQSTYETINGVTYTSRVIKSVAMYAHQSGTYTLDPLVIDVGVNAPYPGNQGFFTMRRLRNVQVASPPKTIKVIPLPSPVPDDFSGAVGQYYVTATPGPTQLTTDDDFSLRVEIQGNGDSRRWDPPEPNIDGNFELYDPRINEDIFNESAGNIVHTRTIEYMMIPQSPGEFRVFIPFTFFNPVTKKYETVRSDTSELQVAQGNSFARRSVTDSIQLVPPPPGIVTDIRTDDRFWTSPAHLALFGLVCSGLLFGLFITVKRKRESQIPESEKLRSAAGLHARQQLELLQKMSSQVSDKLFFEKATEIYYKFLSEKFSIPPADLDKEKLEGYLEKASIADTTVQRAVRFFEQCLSVRYGGIPGGYSRDEMISETKQIIDLLGS